LFGRVRVGVSNGRAILGRRSCFPGAAQHEARFMHRVGSRSAASGGRSDRKSEKGSSPTAARSDTDQGPCRRYWSAPEAGCAAATAFALADRWRIECGVGILRLV